MISTKVGGQGTSVVADARAKFEKIAGREPTTNGTTREPSRSNSVRATRDPSRSAVAELRRLSTLSMKKDLSDLTIPTITENAEDVTGLKGRIRLQKDMSYNWADRQRKNLQAYEYLCHIGEAKEWIEACIAEDIDPIVELEESLRNGIVLAKLVKALEPTLVKKIFMAPGLQFRHSDNINYFFAAIKKVGLPSLFWFELTDLYEKKNIPRVIYCIHALSHLLALRGLTPRIRNLVGKLEFTEEQLHITQRGLDAAGIVMPSFANVGMRLAAELNEPYGGSPTTVSFETSQESEEERRTRYWNEHQDALIRCQSVVRMHQTRRKFLDRQKQHHQFLPHAVRLQALGHGVLARRKFQDRQKQHQQFLPYAVRLQALCRGVLARRALDRRMREFERATPFAVQLQAQARGFLARRERDQRISDLDQSVPFITKLQARARGVLARREWDKRMVEFEQAVPFITRLQAQARGVLVRREWERRVRELEKFEQRLIKFQALCRGALARKKHHERLKHFQDNTDKIVKIQSLYRAKLAGDAYRSLTMGDNPPIGTIKNFIHLLNDSDFDFEEEIDLERLRQLVIQRIRENQQLETHLNNLDIKIALLVKNRITLDEVIVVADSKKRQRRLSQLHSPQGPFSLKSLDKESRHRLELYQQLFYLLQTQPSYLARLFSVMNKSGVPDKTKKMVEGVVLTLFGYAQNAREEYLLLKLFQKSILEELESVDTLQEFLRGNFMFIRLVVHYNRGAKERKFLRDLLGPLVKHIMDDDYMDLETDPLVIYQTLINAEELRTGQPSARPSNIAVQQALNDPETRTVFIHHLQRLRKETDMFIATIAASLDKMPYGIRYIARELKRALVNKFRNETEDAVMKVVGHLVYYRYLNPAIVAPEGFDVIETVVSPMQRKNLAAISKMLNQVSVGKQFSEDNIYLQPLNEYVVHTADQFSNFFKAVTNVQDAEMYFSMNEYGDLASKRKPIIYVTPLEVFSMHQMLSEHLEMLAPQQSDLLHQILQDLGEAPSIEGEANSISNTSELSLTLVSRFAEETINSPTTELSHLFMETKRYVLSIIRVQNGSSLLDILVQPVTDQDEEMYNELTNADKHNKVANKQQQAVDGEPAAHLVDVTTITFAELKKRALQNILRLEKQGKVTRKNNYQDILNSIAIDIRNKHRRRMQRQKEVRQIRQTLTHLDEKRTYLDDQIKNYNDYIDACLKQLTNKKGTKKRIVLPFTRQYYHIRDLQRTTGKVPRFGSFVYTAQRLHEKGVLLSVDGFSQKQFDRIAFTISSDELGVFHVSASYSSLPVPGFNNFELRLEDLLQSQFNNVQVMSLFDGAAKVNVNLLIFLINKKFFV